MRVLAPAIDNSTSTIHTETLCDLIKFILTIKVYFYTTSYINTLQPAIKFTSNYSCMQISSLDAKVSLNDGIIETVL